MLRSTQTGFTVIFFFSSDAASVRARLLLRKLYYKLTFSHRILIVAAFESSQVAEVNMFAPVFHSCILPLILWNAVYSP